MTSFIGRRRELAALTDAVRRHRLITLVGPGGVGKSRLAAALTHHYGAPSWWADDASLPSSALDLIGRGARLVVLDGGGRTRARAFAEVAEHLVMATDATVVVTSRRPLALAGEQRWPVHGLNPREAAALFLARLRESEPRATVDREALADLCAALDGIPLALEIAADQARTTAVRELVADLRRLVRVRAATRSRHDRQRSLVAVVRDSRSGLSPEADLTLGHVHLLVGPFPVHLAEALTSPPLPPAVVRSALVELVDAGLLRSAIGPSGPLFWVPRTTAVIVGHDWTGQTVDELATRRRRAVGTMLHVATSHLHGPDARPWLRLVRARLDDADAALEHARAAGPGALADLVEPLAEIWFWTGDHGRATRWTQPIAGHTPAHTVAATTRAARAALLAGNVGAAAALTGATPSPSTPGPDRERSPPSASAAARYLVYQACADLLSTGSGPDDLTSALDHVRGTGDGHALVESLTLAGEALALVGHATVAESTWVDAHTVVEHTGDVAARGRVLAGLAAAALGLGRPADASALAQRGATAARRSGDAHALIVAEIVLGRCTAAAGDWPAGLRRLRRIQKRAGAAGPGLATMPLHWALAELATGRGLTLDLRTDSRCDPGHGSFLAAVRAVTLARHHIGAGRLDEARTLAQQAGAALAPTEATAWTARARWVLGEVALAAGDLPTARREFRAAVRVAPTTMDPALLADCVDGLVRVAWTAGDRSLARRLLTAVDQWRTEAGWSRSPPVQSLLLPVGHTQPARPPSADEAPGPTGSPRRPTRHGAAPSLAALALHSGGATSSPPEGDVARRLAVLSPAEREVSRLVATGRSNLEVGRELFMSLSTVKTHLTHIYRKLAVTSRAQLAYLLAQQEDPTGT